MESIRAKHNRRLEELKADRMPFEEKWAEFDRFISPGRFKPYADNANHGRKNDQAIIDETGRHAFRTFRSGMQSGQTSPSRPWFKLIPQDPDLLKSKNVKDYLDTCETRMRYVMQHSNLYNVLHAAYGSVGLFGISNFLFVPDSEFIFLAIPMVVGQYWIGQNERGLVNTTYRAVSYTVEQVVERFVAKPDKSMDWSCVSNTVMNAWDRGNYGMKVPCMHAIRPRAWRDAGKLDKKNKAFTSDYWEVSGFNDVMLEESGFDRCPSVCSRWETEGENPYGFDHPADVALSGVKQLQAQQRKKIIAIDKKVDPPLQAPTSLKNSPSSTMPGKITYVDQVGAQNAIRPMFEVDLDIDHLRQDNVELQRRIKDGFYENLFMAISQMDGVQPRNVFELTQRKEEQLLQLGPVIERQQFEQLNPLVDLAFDYCHAANIFPPPPKELEGEKLKVEHVSILAQAQRAVATGSIERVTSFIGGLANGNPNALDKLDVDDTIDQYAELIGAPATIIISTDAANEKRQARAKQQAAAQAAETASQVAPAANQAAQATKTMAEVGQLSQRGGMIGSSDLLSRLGIAG